MKDESLDRLFKNHFDQLNITYDPSQWDVARGMIIDAERERRRTGFLLLLLAGLLISSFIWISWPSQNFKSTALSEGTVSPTNINSQEASNLPQGSNKQGGIGQPAVPNSEDITASYQESNDQNKMDIEISTKNYQVPIPIKPGAPINEQAFLDKTPVIGFMESRPLPFSFQRLPIDSIKPELQNPVFEEQEIYVPSIKKPFWEWGFSGTWVRSFPTINNNSTDEHKNPSPAATFPLSGVGGASWFTYRIRNIGLSAGIEIGSIGDSYHYKSNTSYVDSIQVESYIQNTKTVTNLKIGPASTLLIEYEEKIIIDTVYTTIYDTVTRSFDRSGSNRYMVVGIPIGIDYIVGTGKFELFFGFRVKPSILFTTQPYYVHLGDDDPIQLDQTIRKFNLFAGANSGITYSISQNGKVLFQFQYHKQLTDMFQDTESTYRSSLIGMSVGYVVRL